MIIVPQFERTFCNADVGSRLVVVLPLRCRVWCRVYKLTRSDPESRRESLRIST